MTNLGNLSGDTPVFDISTIHTFEWFGETIRVHPDLSPIELIDIAEELATMEDEQGVNQVLVVKQMWRRTIHTQDFDKFWNLCKKYKVTLEQMMPVQQKIVEGISARPTLLPSDSSDGRKTIITLPAQEQAVSASPLTAMDRMVLNGQLQDRPDLGAALYNIAEHRTA